MDQCYSTLNAFSGSILLARRAGRRPFWLPPATGGGTSTSTRAHPPKPRRIGASHPRIKQIVAEASAQYDMVVIDGPPILGLADASLLASACENVMIVIESGKTRTSAAREAIERIEAAGAHIVGVTLTKSTEEASSYGYRLYQYGYRQVDDKRNEIVMISHQPES